MLVDIRAADTNGGDRIHIAYLRPSTQVYGVLGDANSAEHDPI